MSRYLLTCNCGESVEVETRQAGGQVTCRCGAVLNVPPLRSLRDMPSVAGRVEPPATTWSLRQGLLTACLLFVAGSAIAAGYFWLTLPQMPKLDLVARQQYVTENVEKMTPVEGWEIWVQFYRPLSQNGFEPFKPPGHELIAARVWQGRLRLAIALVLLTVGLVAVAAVALVGWRR